MDTCGPERAFPTARGVIAWRQCKGSFPGGCNLFRFLLRLTAAVILFAGTLVFAALGLAWLDLRTFDDRVIEDALTRPVLLAWVDRSRGRLRVVPDGCVCDRTLRADEVPDVVRAALVATEDRRFYDHRGIDPQSLLRAVAVNTRRLAAALPQGRRPALEGGSTLTQQLVKVTLTGADRGIRRKAVEAILALRLETLYGKDDLIRLYLSRVEFGRIRGVPIHGLRDAARVYFGRRPANLTLEQAVILVGMINGPSLYHPIRRPENAVARARLVLARMAGEGVLPRDPRGALRDHLPKTHVAVPLRRRFIEDLLAAELRRSAAAEALPDGLYRAVATIDAVAQYRARQFMVEEVAGAAGRGVARGALVTLDPEGRILALVGDVNYARSNFNIAMRGERQAASTAKIATYLAALEAGWTADSTVWDDQTRLKGPFRPRNDDRTYKSAVPLETCLRESRNVCTYWLAEQVGFDAVAEMATRTGLTLRDEPGKSVVLGAAETTPARMAAVFAAMTNGGTRVEPHVLKRVIGPFAVLHGRGPPPGVPLALAPETVPAMRALLRQVVTSGTGSRAKFRGADSFGKTGTSQNYRDAWFAGFTTDDITTVVWVGPEEGGAMRGVVGGSLPAEIYRRFNLSLVDRFHGYKTGGALPR